jgi:hypothetical protein
MQLSKSVVMRTFLLVASLILTAVASAEGEKLKANEVVPVIDGEVFDRIVVIKGETSDSSQIIKYIRSTEELKSWTKQVVYTRLNEAEIKTAGEYAAALVRALQQVSPGAKYKASASEDGKVVLLDFIVQPRGQNFMELNLYRIEEGAKGVYSLQMIGRLPTVETPTAESLAPLIQMRQAWMAQTAKFDMSKVKALLDSQ